MSEDIIYMYVQTRNTYCVATLSIRTLVYFKRPPPFLPPPFLPPPFLYIHIMLDHDNNVLIYIIYICICYLNITTSKKLCTYVMCVCKCVWCAAIDDRTA